MNPLPDPRRRLPCPAVRPPGAAIPAALAAGLFVLAAGCGGSPPVEDPVVAVVPDARAQEDAEAAVRAVLEAQAAAWNEGDLPTFVDYYLDSPDTRFVSGNTALYGVEDLLDRYRRTYPDRAAMGTLSFADLDIRVLSPDFAFVFGRFHLERESDAPTGLFTLLVERAADGWKISHDHTSS